MANLGSCKQNQPWSCQHEPRSISSRWWLCQYKTCITYFFCDNHLQDEILLGSCWQDQGWFCLHEPRFAITPHYLRNKYNIPSFFCMVFSV